MNPDDLRDLGALQHDMDAEVPRRLEEGLVSAFRVHRGLAALRDDDQITVPPPLEARLVEAFREHHARGTGRPSALRRFTWHLARAAVLVAAVAGAVWFGQLRSPGTSSDLPHAPRNSAAPQPSPAAHGALPHTRQMTSVSRSAARSRVDARQAGAPLPGRALAGAGVATSAPAVGRPDEFNDAGFMPFSYGDASPGDEAHVVSVVLPRSAFLDFGAQAEAVPDDAAAVRAEVLMSEDGMPRGIRFVDRAPAPVPRPSGLGRTPLPTRRRLQP